MESDGPAHFHSLSLSVFTLETNLHTPYTCTDCETKFLLEKKPQCSLKQGKPHWFSVNTLPTNNNPALE